MQQPKPISTLVKVTTSTLPTTSFSDRRQLISQVACERAAIVRQRYGTKSDLLSRATPAVQPFFAEHKEAAIMGDYPTLSDLNNTYGAGSAADWLLPQIANLATAAGARNLTLQQELELASVIATEYRHLKITELMLFFFRTKAGHYGRFYGSVDPMVITCALRDFLRDRNDLIDYYDRERRRREREQQEADAMTLDEWLEIKTITAMYNSDYTVP